MGGIRKIIVGLVIDIERIEVFGIFILMIDMIFLGILFNIGEVELDCFLVFCNVIFVVLFVFSIIVGDSCFGNLVLFGGLLVVENVVYINGLNVINFRIGIGFLDVFFEFYE